MPNLPIRMIATDIDGTLLDRHSKLAEENIRAIREAQKRGIIFAIASGRYPENSYVMLHDYGITCPISGLNGGNTMDEKLHPLAVHYMNAASAAQILEILVSHGADYFLFADHCVCTARNDLKHHTELSYGREIREMGFTFAYGPDVARRVCARGQVFKFFVCNNVPLQPLREAFGNVPYISLTQSGETNIEVMPQGIDKSLGVRDLADHYQIPLSQVMTLGDQENDIPMLSAVGCGVAVGNASESTKAAARYVTDSNDNCGFAKAVYQYALGLSAGKENL